MAITPSASKRRVRHSLPAVLMRAGTSKGLFIHRSHLPPSEKEWATPLLAALGSKYSDARQIDGVGGGSSVTSKVAVVAPSSQPGIDVEYTFVQVAVGSESVDLSGNCGNICSGVGPFAVQERLVTPLPGAKSVDVRILNTNTSKLIVETVCLDEDGNVEEDGDCLIPGVKGPGSEIKVAFVEPIGSMTGKLFPSGHRSERLIVEEVTSLGPFKVEATLIDSANPFVLVDSESLPPQVKTQLPDSPMSLEVAEAIRRRGAVLMGLAGTLEEAGMVRGTPKLAYLSRPTSGGLTKRDADIRVQAYSMGKPHPSLQLTGGVTLASAMIMEGTVAHRIASLSMTLHNEGIPTPRRTPSPSAIKTGDLLLDESESLPFQSDAVSRIIRIEHGSGTMEVEAWARQGEHGLIIDRCVVLRTARRLFEGNVLYYT
ncbi:methylitaconate delta2-delta3-isomerase [Colletotrichum truncatum]|uniref:Methylitaconate delta2-delta3-isomerase n=1 Tax=Colletotrichum truncatum TaxID=5467 RepID=A0ACC3ZF86_COLTU|nr:methylitaconate delta2-delta3-isomerase [Colletotrichum truncatum]KAF6801682.1 methylitaconate delta2-delta3-isomerase [Colletotrichum truncatum]